MHGGFPAEITVRTPYIPINVWFWPVDQEEGATGMVPDLLVWFWPTLRMTSLEQLQFPRFSSTGIF